ncbi:MAG TPA: ABC transporter permease [Urbifossiella sp.]|nr:ABC transporter permease [Urbifossiella sp.]
MSYALLTLWHERQRYVSGVFAVTFSAMLIALQCGLLLGLFKITSIPIDHATPWDRDRVIWVGSTGAPSVDLGKPIPVGFLTRLAGREGLSSPELYIANFGNFTKPVGGTELCFLLGTRLDDEALAPADVLTPELRAALSEPFTIVVDRSDIARLKLDSPEGKPKINGKEVRVVGVVTGLRSLAAPWVFCSTHTARQLMGPLLPADHTTYLLARADTRERAKQIVADLRAAYSEDMSAYVAEDFSYSSREYWLLRTKAGVAIGYAALLGLLVGAVITAQTLKTATEASAREFAILLALGIPRWRISLMVLQQSMWVAVIGMGLAYPVCLGLRQVALMGGADVDLRWEVLSGTAALTTLMCTGAGLWALRGVRQIEPMSLLR